MSEDNQTVPPARGPGRPPQQKIEAKKGKPTWKPANVDDVYDREPGYRYRWVRKEEDNIAKKSAENWVRDEAATVESGYGRINEGKPLTSVRERRDAILMRMPEEMAQERDAYYNTETSRRMSALKRQTRDDLSQAGAPIHGGISIEKRGNRTVIKD
jgi:hypothetical protein